MSWIPAETRYASIPYRRCGRSGVLLPALSLGFWHNFGTADATGAARAMARKAFDLGIVHFDLANNYGPPPGAAERTLGHFLQDDFASHRDELFISTKAGYTMWPGPYGDHGSRKYLLASLDASLGRLGLDYVDLFYSHRPDFETPLEETVEALVQAVRSGKALYVGLSNYPADRTREAARLLRERGVACLVHQPKYHLFERWIEGGLLEACAGEGMGIACFMPLAQGLLTDRYLAGIPADSRAAGPSPFLTPESVTEERIATVRALNEIARRRGQSLAQMAIAWTLRDPRVTTTIIGASRPEQIVDNARALEAPPLTAGELEDIEKALAG